MKRLQFYFHKDPVKANSFLYLILIPLCFFIFCIYPLQSNVDTSNTFSTTFVAADGTPLAYELQDSGRADDIPVLEMDTAILDVLAFVIAREDPRLLSQNSIRGKFWINYRGVSVRNLNLFSNGGGSTLSQQFLKWLANTRMITDFHQRTIISKLGEMAGAYKLTGIYSPTQILQLYINEVGWLNATSNGIQLNVIKYFNVHSIRELNLYERYILARSVKGVKSAGIDFREIMTISRDSLDVMFGNSFRSMLVDNGRATEEDLRKMLAMPVRFRKRPLSLHDKPYLFDLVKPLNDSLKFRGAQFISTLQPGVIDAIDNSLELYARANRGILQIGNNILDVNVVVVDSRSGDIIGVNSAPLYAPKTKTRMQNHIFTCRPAASTIKPLMIAKGLEGGFIRESSLLFDEYHHRIHNYSPVYYGKVSLSFVVKKSLNTAIDNFANRDNMVDSVEKDLSWIFGNEIPALPKDYSKSQYCLGEPRLLNVVQLAQLYRAVVTDGNVIKSRITKTIISTSSYPFDTVYNWHPASYKIFSLQTCKAMRAIMKAPLEEGGTLYSVAGLLVGSKDVMGKTGTSDSYKYGWTILISEPYVVVVSMSYWDIRNTNGDSKKAVPTKSGAGSCGFIAATILNKLKN